METTHSDAAQNDSTANINTNTTALGIIIDFLSYLQNFVRFGFLIVMTASMRMEVTGSSKMLLNVYQTTWHHISEDSKLYKIFIENLM